MALIAVILLLMVMPGLCAAVAISGNTETMIARNHQVSAEARAAAEAGLIHAVELVTEELEDWSEDGFASASAAMTVLLRGPDAATGTSATSADDGSLESFGIPRSPTTLALNGLPDISYRARVYDEDDTGRGVTLSAVDRTRIGEAGNVGTTDENTRIVVQATGIASGGATATVEAIISPLVLPAVVTNGGLTISGNPIVSGTKGSVHSNEDLLISGDPVISQNATASSTYTASGHPTVGGTSGGSAATMTVPSIQAADYLDKADYILRDNGLMTNAAGTTICNASADAGACEDIGYGWEYEGANGWRINSNSVALGGTYYVEGNATISGSPGSSLVPLQISIIAEGSIEISGNPDLAPDSPELMFVTDGDLKISGGLALSTTLEGQMLVHEQVSISGNPVLAGQILVENATSVSSLVSANSISGNPTIVYNGIAGSAMFTISAWRWAQ